MNNLSTLLLVQTAFIKLQAQLVEELQRAGYKDIKPVHGKVFAWIDVENGSQSIELAARARVTKQFMGQLIKELEELGYLKRVAHPEDKRAFLVKLTAKGKRSVVAAKAAIDKLEENLLKELSESDFLQLKVLLAKLIQKI